MTYNFKKLLGICSIFLLLIGCKNSATPYLKISLNDLSKNQIRNEILFDNGKLKSTSEFRSMDFKRYTAAKEDFSSSVLNSKVINQVTAYTFFDENNTEIEASSELIQLLNVAASKIPHDIISLEVIQCEEDYFAFVKLNVNWQDPCILYHFDPTNNTFIELARWDNVDLIGLSLILQ